MREAGLRRVGVVFWMEPEQVLVHYAEQGTAQLDDTKRELLSSVVLGAWRQARTYAARGEWGSVAPLMFVTVVAHTATFETEDRETALTGEVISVRLLANEMMLTCAALDAVNAKPIP